MKNKREETSFSTKLSYLLIGGGIGAIIALLFAPKSGQELRGDIADATRKGIETGRETAVLVGERAGDYYEVTRERASELYQTAQEKASQYKSKAGELTDRAREAAQGANPFSAAVEAGKEAYEREKYLEFELQGLEGDEDIDFPTREESEEMEGNVDIDFPIKNK